MVQQKAQKPSWVFWSTRDTINAEIPSLTAIIETIVAVMAYWWFAIRYETYALLLISVAVAPLVLLRSAESMRDGIRWFFAMKAALNSLTSLSAHPQTVLTATITLSAAITAAVAIVFFSHSATMPALMAVVASFVIGGVGVGFVLGGDALAQLAKLAPRGGIKNFLFHAIILSPGGAGFLLRHWVVSVLARFGATLANLGWGLRTLPLNFRRLALCTSPAHKPELLPGLPAEMGGPFIVEGFVDRQCPNLSFTARQS